MVAGKLAHRNTRIVPPPATLPHHMRGNPVAEAAAYGTSGGWAVGEPRLPYQRVRRFARTGSVAVAAKKNCLDVSEGDGMARRLYA